MTIIIDRRNTKTTKNASNRDKFIKRYKKHIKRAIDETIEGRSVTDHSPQDVVIDQGKSINEPDIDYSKDKGHTDSVVSGNKHYEKGDLIAKPNSDGSGTGDGGGEDSFTFTLSKEEFLDIYFSDMCLPDFIKESMLDTTKITHKRAGFIKDGLPARLDVLKTLQMSIMRRLSNKDPEKKPPFLDDIDLRYRHYKDVPEPMLKAVMFCLMDVSGSMLDHHKFLSKKFFMFLYLFLNKNYESVDIRFIRYHHESRDCSEDDFFYAKDTGGTVVTKGLNLINNIIDNEYPLNVYNIYIAHTSDGDFGVQEGEADILKILDESLITKIQYYAYLQVQTPHEYFAFNEGKKKLYGILEKSIHIDKKLNIETALAAEDIYAVLHNLFKKGE